MMNENEERTTHPSYGMIGIYRHHTGGNRHLFGSDLPNHFNTLVIRVKRAERISDECGERVRGLQEIVEVEMSAAQFAELITTPNTGDGVPCTLRCVGRERQAEPIQSETKLDRQRRKVEERAKDFLKSVEAEFAEIDSIVDKRGTMTVKERERIGAQLQRIQMELRSNMPFLVETFQEACEGLVASAKAEIDAALTTAVHKAGFEALAARRDATLAIDTTEVWPHQIGPADIVE